MIRATWHGAVLAESDQTVVVEGNHYFPPESVCWEYLQASPSHTRCPWKGTASYYSVVVDGSENRDAAWYYADPKRAASKIAGRIAFWRGVRVERVGDDGTPERRSVLSRLLHRNPRGDLVSYRYEQHPMDGPAPADDAVTTVTDADGEAFTTGGYSVIDFFAPWCGPCHHVAPLYAAAAARHGDRLRFGRCDVDENPRIAAQLGIMSIPTLVVFDSVGREVDRMVGAVGERQLDSFLRRAVPGAA